MIAMVTLGDSQQNSQCKVYFSLGCILVYALKVEFCLTFYYLLALLSRVTSLV